MTRCVELFVCLRFLWPNRDHFPCAGGGGARSRLMRRSHGGPVAWSSCVVHGAFSTAAWPGCSGSPLGAHAGNLFGTGGLEPSGPALARRSRPCVLMCACEGARLKKEYCGPWSCEHSHFPLQLFDECKVFFSSFCSSFCCPSQRARPNWKR